MMKTTTVTFLLAAAAPLSPADLETARKTGLILWCAQKPEQDIPELINRMDGAESRFDLILDANVSVSRITRLANYLRSES